MDTFHRCGFYMIFLFFKTFLIINELIREVALVERYKKWEGDLKSEGQGKDARFRILIFPQIFYFC
jgi:hypothetical protein